MVRAQEVIPPGTSLPVELGTTLRSDRMHVVGRADPVCEIWLQSTKRQVKVPSGSGLLLRVLPREGVSMEWIGPSKIDRI